MLRWRLISASVILALLLSLMWLDYLFGVPGAWLLPILLIVSILATEEALSLLRARQHRPIGWIAYLGNVMIPLTVGLPIVVGLFNLLLPDNLPLANCGLPLAALAAIVMLAFIAEMSRFERPGAAIVDIALTLFIVVYIGVAISFWALLRLHGNNAWGMTALFSMLLIVKFADTGAFAIGKKFGRHKLTPVLSPGKTWEGAIGGVLTACLVSWAFFHWAAPMIVGKTYAEPPLIATLLYGTLLSMAGMLGDLAESLFKRDMQRKDSSTWLPGLGGVLDIIDAPLIAGPVAWLFWTLGLLGP